MRRVVEGGGGSPKLPPEIEGEHEGHDEEGRPLLEHGHPVRGRRWQCGGGTRHFWGSLLLGPRGKKQ